MPLPTASTPNPSGVGGWETRCPWRPERAAVTNAGLAPARRLVNLSHLLSSQVLTCLFLRVCFHRWL